ncbi:unnamed protein product [Ectocarpus sp. 12 AP-2014]
MFSQSAQMHTALHHDLMTRGTRHGCVHHSHEAPYAALIVAMAMTVTATSAGPAGSCVRGAATCTPPFYSSSGINTNALLAFGAVAKPTSRLGSGESRVVAAKHRVQTLSMKLAAAPVRTPSATSAAIGGDSTAVSPSHSSVRRRRRRRPTSIGERGGGSAAEGGVLHVGGTNIIGVSTSSNESSPTPLSWTGGGGGGGMESLEQKITGSSVNGIGGGVIFPESAWVGRRRPEAVGAPGLGGLSGGSASGGGGFAGGGLDGGRVRGVGVVTGGWHPAAEPTEDQNDGSHHDSWRKMRVEELIKDPFLTPGRINEIMDPNNIQRHQYNTNPDSSYGAVFQLDTLVDVIPGLIYPAWLEVARALNQNAPTLHTVERGYGWTPEQMFLREFNWRLTQEELEGGLEIYERTILRQALKYQPTETRGSRRWLETLRTIPMPMAVLSRLPSAIVDAILEKTELSGYFEDQHRVTAEDEPYDDYRGYMLAALKIQRSTMKCCAFDCRQEGMIKAHDADLRGVCRIGVMAAWELRLSDLSVESFDDMNVLNFRQIFADREFEPGMLQLELEPEAEPMRQTQVATKVDTRWPDEEDEPEPWAEGGGGDGDGRRGGGGGGGGGLRRRW